MAVAVAQTILPDEPQMHVVEKAMSVNDLMYLLYEVPSAVTVENFKRVRAFGVRSCFLLLNQVLALTGKAQRLTSATQQVHSATSNFPY